MIDELVRLVKPPVNPIHLGRYGDVRKIEKRIGLELPDDFIDLGCHYGSGSFCIHNFMISFLNPFDPDFLQGQEGLCCPSVKGYLEWVDTSEFLTADPPYKVYPEEGGLLPIFNDNNGCILCYDTDGSPNDWPLVALPRLSGEYESYAVGLCEFLVEHIKEERACLIWPGQFEGRPKITFEPASVKSLCGLE